MRIWTRKSALIQPRTSLGKSDGVVAHRGAGHEHVRVEPEQEVHLRERPRRITLCEARSRLDQRRFSRPNTHFAAFFKLYKKIIFSRANLQNFAKISRNFAKILRIFENFQKKCKILRKKLQKFCRIFTKFCEIL